MKDKSIILKLGMIAAMLLSFTSASAYDFEADGIRYNILSDTYAEVAEYNSYAGDLVIPEIVEHNGKYYTVKQIGGYAFYQCTSLTSVTIPCSVTSIGKEAFYNCISLTSVAIPNSVTSIGKWAFAGCSSLASATLPNSVTSIGDFTFNYCTSLTSVTIPNSVTSIGDYTFYFCTSLISVTIPNSITSIGEGAFAGCSSLASATLPNSITSIGGWTFESCSSLTSVTISNSVTSIGDYAFAYCSSLASVTIPNSVTSIGEAAFVSCNSLASATLPNSFTSIGKWTFENCSSLSSVIIPNSVTSIGDYAFQDCTSLDTVTIGNGVETIGVRAFSGCSSLDCFSAGSNVESIGVQAFSGCTGLTKYYSFSIVPPVCGYQALDDISKQDCTLYVPAGSIDKYKAANQWKDFFFVNEMEAIKATDVILSNSEISLYCNDTYQLTATVLPEDTTDATIEWSSSDSSVAEVDADGLVTARAAGTATITARCGEATAQCEVTVRAKVITVVSITLSQTTAELTEGESVKLTATVLPEDTTDATVEWSSSDSSIAEVDADGLVTARAAGSAIITARCGEATAQCEVIVSAKVIAAESITLSQTTAELTEGESMKLTATVLPEDTTDKTVEWSSSDSNVAEVDADGLVIARAAGTATITARCGEATAQCEVTVVKADGIDSIGIDGTTAFDVYDLTGHYLGEFVNISDLDRFVGKFCIIIYRGTAYKIKL